MRYKKKQLSGSGTASESASLFDLQQFGWSKWPLEDMYKRCLLSLHMEHLRKSQHSVDSLHAES